MKIHQFKHRPGIILLSAAILGVLLYAGNSFCRIVDYANGVTEDTRHAFETNKRFIYNISFNATVTDKIFRSKYETGRYALRLNVYNVSPKPFIGSTQYQPYYSFENDTLLTISVSQQLFESAYKGQEISKPGNSNYLVIDKNKVDLISENNSVWLPTDD